MTNPLTASRLAGRGATALAGCLAAVVMAAALSAVPTARAAGPGSGFSSDSCELGSHVVPGSGAVLEVGAGQPFSTIGAAVAAASEGDTVLVHPGSYREEVHVWTPGLRIRGTDRDAVVLDGEHLDGDGQPARHAFGIAVWSDRVLVENMTGRGYTHTAFYWTGAVGYWGRNLTATNNGLYGLYAYDSRCGQLNDSYANGNADSGFYIGECFACDAVIHDVVAEGNAIGYSGTNAGGNLVIRDSLWTGNAMGIVPNSLDSEQRPPQRGATIVGNTVVENNQIDAPGSGLAAQFWGVGIAVAGGKGNVVWNNVVSNHAKVGIVVGPLPDENVWIPSGNAVWGNTVGHDPDPRFDGAWDLAQGMASGPDNCWTDNRPGPGQALVTAPLALEQGWSCGSTFTPPGGDPRVEVELASGALGANGRDPHPWETWPVTPHPAASIDLVDGDCDTGGDCAVDRWLPALGLS